MEAVYNGAQALLYSAIVYTMVGFDHNIGKGACLQTHQMPILCCAWDVPSYAACAVPYVTACGCMRPVFASFLCGHPFAGGDCLCMGVPP